ncbi:MAG: hypothetical protein RLZZ255_77, partial [Cyanobacteriota bacterium]
MIRALPPSACILLRSVKPICVRLQAQTRRGTTVQPHAGPLNRCRQGPGLGV